MNKNKGTPIGFVARCPCGNVIGAMDYTRMERKDAGKVLGQWLFNGCTVEPRFGSGWSETIKGCECCFPDSEEYEEAA